MNWFEIVLLIAGLAAFIISFLIPSKENQSSHLKQDEEKIRKVVDEQIKEAKSNLQESVDETINYAVEKAERSLERVTNEKIMAVNEYSDTVLSDINKNHEEAVFLYSMLNDKHNHLKDTVANVSQTAKEAVSEVNHAKEVAMSVKEVVDAVEKSEMIVENKDNSIDKIGSFEKLVHESVSDTKMKEFKEKEFKEKEFKEKESKEKKSKGKESSVKTKEFPASSNKIKEMNIPIISAQGEGNNNEKILQLYREGKSNVMIAKELGLGVGEVKLVIDLFMQGGKK